MAYYVLYDLAFVYFFILTSCYSGPVPDALVTMEPLLFLNWNHILSLASRSLPLSRTFVFLSLSPVHRILSGGCIESSILVVSFPGFS